MPFLITLDKHEDSYKAGRFLRASDLGSTSEHAEWKPVIFDEATNDIIVPNGTMGQRWEEDTKWNLILDNADGTRVEPALSLAEHGAEWGEIVFPFFDNVANGTFKRPIPSKKIQFADGTERLVQLLTI